MEADFTLLAPHYGTRPITSFHIGNSSLSGGAINWGNIWSGIKSIGSNVKSWSDKAWNSSTGQMLRQKLKDTNVQEKLVDTLASGVHGALDIANQQLQKAINKRLDPIPEAETTDADEVVEREEVNEKPTPLVVDMDKGRHKQPYNAIPPPLPPTYDEVLQEIHSSQPKEIFEPIEKKYDTPPPAVVHTLLPPSNRRGWQNTLNDIVGVGLRGIKRRRCY